MALPLVSIITPTYNHRFYIRACIESVLAQTYRHWELIIVDDGSSDNTPEIISEYAAQDGRIKPYFQANKGPERLHETYNLALENARGEWIAVLEGDDYWLPAKLELQLAAHTPATIFSYGIYLDKVGNALYYGKRPSFTGTIPLSQFIPILLCHQSCMLAVTQLIRREGLATIGGFHQDGSPAAVDMATLMRLVKLPGDVVYVPHPLGVWRHHQRQSTNLRMVQLAEFNSQLAINFYDTLPSSQKKALAITRQEIVRARHAQIADAYFGVLRQKLRRRQKAGIGELIMGLWRFGGSKRKLQALYAAVAAVMGWDYEPILHFAEKATPETSRLPYKP